LEIQIQNLKFKIKKCEFIASWIQGLKKRGKIDQKEFETRQNLNQKVLEISMKELLELETGL